MQQEGKVYFIVDTNNNIKIGFTKGSIKKRIQQLQTGSQSKIYELGWINGTIDDEKKLHKQFSNCRIRYDGEWFSANDNLLDYINKNNQKPNTYVDWVNGKLMPLLSLSC